MILERDPPLAAKLRKFGPDYFFGPFEDHGNRCINVIIPRGPHFLFQLQISGAAETVLQNQ